MSNTSNNNLGLGFQSFLMFYIKEKSLQPPIKYDIFSDLVLHNNNNKVYIISRIKFKSLKFQMQNY